MAVFELGHVYRASVRWLYNTSDEQVNVWHFQVVGGIPSSDAAQRAAFEEVLTDLYGDIPGFMSSLLNHQDVSLFDETTDTPMVSIGRIAALDGGSTADPLPTGVSAFIYAKTNRSRTIGRKFLPTMTESYTSSGQWVSGLTDELELMGNRWLVGLESTDGMGVQFGVFGEAGGWRVPIGTSYSAYPAYQRRRRIGAGR